MVKGALASTLTVAARGWTQVAAVALLLVAARRLDIAGFGEFAVASALTLMLSQWVGVGCYERVLSTHGAHRALDTSFVINSVGGLAMAAVGVVMGFIAEHIYGSWTIATMVWLLAPLAVFSGWRSAGESAMLGDGRLVRFAVATIAVESMALAAGAFALIEGHGVYALVLAKYLQLGLGGPAFLVFAGRMPRLDFDWPEAAAIYKLWRSLIVDRVLSYFQNYSGDLLLGAFLSPAAAGVYRISIRIVSLVNTIISDPLRSLGWTLLAKRQRQGGSITQTSEAIIGLVYVLLCGPLALLALVGGDLAVAALGLQWAQTGPVIALLALAAIVMVPSLISEAAFGVGGMIHQLPHQRLVFVGVGLALMIASAPFGPSWTAASQLVASLISLGVVVRGQRIYVGIRVSGYTQVASWALISAVAAVGVAGILGQLPGLADTSVRLPAQIVLGMGVYLLLVLSHSGTRDALVAFSRAVSEPLPSQDMPVELRIRDLAVSGPR